MKETKRRLSRGSPIRAFQPNPEPKPSLQKAIAIYTCSLLAFAVISLGVWALIFNLIGTPTNVRVEASEVDGFRADVGSAEMWAYGSWQLVNIRSSSTIVFSGGSFPYSTSFSLDEPPVITFLPIEYMAVTPITKDDIGGFVEGNTIYYRLKSSSDNQSGADDNNVHPVISSISLNVPFEQAAATNYFSLDLGWYSRLYPEGSSPSNSSESRIYISMASDGVIDWRSNDLRIDCNESSGIYVSSHSEGAGALYIDAYEYDIHQAIIAEIEYSDGSIDTFEISENSIVEIKGFSGATFYTDWLNIWFYRGLDISANATSIETKFSGTVSTFDSRATIQTPAIYQDFVMSSDSAKTRVEMSYVSPYANASDGSELSPGTELSIAGYYDSDDKVELSGYSLKPSFMYWLAQNPIVIGINIVGILGIPIPLTNLLLNTRRQTQNPAPSRNQPRS